MLGESQTLDVQRFIDERGISPFQWMIFAACFALVAVDTYDIVAIGFVAPVIREQWAISQATLGPVMSLSVIGMAAGALLGGPVTDRTSPKTVMVAATLLFGACSLGSAFSRSIASLAALRLATGIGIGAAIPLAPMLVFEYSATRRSLFLVNLMVCGGALGSVLCGIVTAALVPRFGWQSVFVVGGVLPIALATASVIFVPEPIRYLVHTGAAAERIRSILKRIDVSAKLEGVSFVISEATLSAGDGVSLVLAPEYRTGTFMIWLTYFSAMSIYYLLASWLPMFIRSSGGTVRQAALIPTLFTAGAVIGGIGLGLLLKRAEKNSILAGAFVLGGLSIFVMGQVMGHLTWLAVAIFVAGFTFYGATSSMSALASAFYPTGGRATGVAWMYGCGRLGGILAPLAGGTLLQAGYTPRTIVSLLVLPALVAAGALFVKRTAEP